MDVVESREVRVIALLGLLAVFVGPLALATPRVARLPLAAGVGLGALAVTPPVTRRVRDRSGDGSAHYPWYYHAALAAVGVLTARVVGGLLPDGLLLALAWFAVGAVGTAAVGLLVRLGL